VTGQHLAIGSRGSSASAREIALFDPAVPMGDRGFNSGDVFDEWLSHDQDHLEQILANLKSAHLPAMTAPRRRVMSVG
jgi:hypothetical protein